MDRTLNISAANGVVRNVRLVGYPDECPRCHSKIVPKGLIAVGCSSVRERDVEETYQCTNGKCERAFIGTFKFVADATSPSRYNLAELSPMEFQAPPVSDSVRELSPNFVEIYSQALVAESKNLHQLTGIGLRKALEFLAKDFAIFNFADRKEKILKMQLGSCIEDYIEDQSVKAMAKRAAWLGNDETHYVRKWEDKDVSDLKILIRLTMNGIENSILAKKYSDEMPDSK